MIKRAAVARGPLHAGHALFRPLPLTVRRPQLGLRWNTPQYGPFGGPGMDSPEPDGKGQEEPRRNGPSRRLETLYKMFENAATTFASLAVLG